MAILQLSNGNKIYDFAGNLWEWTNWSLSEILTLAPTSCREKWSELSEVICEEEELNPKEYLPINSSHLSIYGSDYGLGRIYGGQGGAALRGGSWYSGTSAGIYALYLAFETIYLYNSIGFRCVYRLNP